MFLHILQICTMSVLYTCSENCLIGTPLAVPFVEVFQETNLIPVYIVEVLYTEERATPILSSSMSANEAVS